MCLLQFDFVKLLDGKALPRSLTDPVSGSKTPKGLLLSGLQETGFIEYMDPGTWHLALYNDGRGLEQVLLHSTPIGERRGGKNKGKIVRKHVYVLEKCEAFLFCFSGLSLLSPHSLLRLRLLTCRAIIKTVMQTWPQVPPRERMTFDGNFFSPPLFWRVSLARRGKAVSKGRTAQVIMTGLANCSSLPLHTRMAAQIEGCE